MWFYNFRSPTNFMNMPNILGATDYLTNCNSCGTTQKLMETYDLL